MGKYRKSPTTISSDLEIVWSLQELREIDKTKSQKSAGLWPAYFLSFSALSKNEVIYHTMLRHSHTHTQTHTQTHTRRHTE